MRTSPPLLCELHAHTTSGGALGLHDLCDLYGGAAARAHWAALVDAHPYSPADVAGSPRGTAAFAARPHELAPLVGRLELFDRSPRPASLVELGGRATPLAT